jgi:hypothetical protein
MDDLPVIHLSVLYSLAGQVPLRTSSWVDSSKRLSRPAFRPARHITDDKADNTANFETTSEPWLLRLEDSSIAQQRVSNIRNQSRRDASQEIAKLTPSTLFTGNRQTECRHCHSRWKKWVQWDPSWTAKLDTIAATIEGEDL